MINIKIDMLQIKRDRLKEIKRQIIKYSNKKNWNMVYQLMKEQRELKEEIKSMGEKSNGR